MLIVVICYPGKFGYSEEKRQPEGKSIIAAVLHTKRVKVLIGFSEKLFFKLLT
jgi:hypothetical protein